MKNGTLVLNITHKMSIDLIYMYCCVQDINLAYLYVLVTSTLAIKIVVHRTGPQYTNSHVNTLNLNIYVTVSIIFNLIFYIIFMNVWTLMYNFLFYYLIIHFYKNNCAFEIILISLLKIWYFFFFFFFFFFDWNIIWYLPTGIY
jgi:hypothetical protein